MEDHELEFDLRKCSLIQKVHSNYSFGVDFRYPTKLLYIQSFLPPGKNTFIFLSIYSNNWDILEEFLPIWILLII